jgi:hypothetical protein
MAKTKPATATSEDQQFPSQILYSSPPEASSLKAWVREIEQKQRGNAAASEPKAPTDD